MLVMIYNLLDINIPTEPTSLVSSFGVYGSIILISIYLIYQLIRDYMKSKNETIKSDASIKFQNAIYEQLKDTNKLNSEILNYLKDVSAGITEEITEQQSKIIVERILEASKYAIKSNISRIMKENHIEGNEQDIKSKIVKYIENRYGNDVLAAKEYRYKGKQLSSFFRDEWHDEITTNMLQIVFNRKTERALQASLSNSFDSFKNQIIADIL